MSLKSFLFKKRSRNLLNDLGIKYKTDKVDGAHSFAGKSYLDIYDLYFRELRRKEITMLEIGIKEGASLRTFRDYFSKGRIIGLDINPETFLKEKGIKTYIGSQSSEKVINNIFNENPTINIVLDDGSHINELTLASFNLIFNKVSKGGYYIIEDMVCTYLEDNLKSDIIRGSWPGMNLNDQSLELVNRRSDMDQFFQGIIKDLDKRKGEIEFIHFWAQLCIIKKL